MDASPCDSAAVVNAVKDIIEQYNNGTIDHELGAPGTSGPDFDRKPDELEFPEINAISDLESVEPINGYEEVLIIKMKCSGEYVMQIWVDTGDAYQVTSVMFFG